MYWGINVPFIELLLAFTFTQKGHVQYSTVAITIFCIVCSEAVGCGLDDV